jgi:hypothetical protein
MRSQSFGRTSLQTVFSATMGGTMIFAVMVMAAVLSTVLMPPPAKAVVLPPSTVTVGARTGDDTSDGYLDILAPISAYKKGLIYFNPRFGLGEAGSNEVNVGLGIRQLLGKSDQYMLGGNVYYDYRKTEYDADFNQFGAGLEFFSKWVDARANYYYPEDEIEKIASRETEQVDVAVDSRSSSSTRWNAPFATGHEIRQTGTTATTTTTTTTTTTIRELFEQFESGKKGFDAEVGLLLPLNSLGKKKVKLPEVRVFGGYYDFEDEFGNTAEGGKGRLEIRATHWLKLDAEIFEDDKLNGTDYFVGARVETPLDWGGLFKGKGKKAFPSGKRATYTSSMVPRLNEMVIRDVRVQTDQSDWLKDEAATTKMVDVDVDKQVKKYGVKDVILDDINFVKGGRTLAAPAGASVEEQGDASTQGDAGVAMPGGMSDGTEEDPFRNIGRAVKNAKRNDRDVVYVYEGIYTENVRLAPGISLIGEGDPVQGHGGQSYGGGKYPVIMGMTTTTGSPAEVAGSTNRREKIAAVVTMAPDTTVRGFEIMPFGYYSPVEDESSAQKPPQIVGTAGICAGDDCISLRDRNGANAFELSPDAEAARPRRYNDWGNLVVHNNIIHGFSYGVRIDLDGNGGGGGGGGSVSDADASHPREKGKLGNVKVTDNEIYNIGGGTDGIKVDLEDFDIAGSIDVSRNSVVGVIGGWGTDGIDVEIEDSTVGGHVKIKENFVAGVAGWGNTSGIELEIEDTDVDGSVSVSRNTVLGVAGGNLDFIAQAEAVAIKVEIEGDSGGNTIGKSVKVNDNTAGYVIAGAAGFAGISKSAGIDVDIEDMDINGSVSVSRNDVRFIGDGAAGVIAGAEAKAVEVTIEGDSSSSGSFAVRRDVQVNDNTAMYVGSLALGGLSFSESAGVAVEIEDMDVDGSVSVSGNDAQNIFAASVGGLAVTEAKGVDVSIEGDDSGSFAVGGEVEVDGNTAMNVTSVALGLGAFSESRGIDLAIEDMNVGKDVSVSRNYAGNIGDPSIGAISSASAKGVELTVEGESYRGFTVGGNVKVDGNTAMDVTALATGLLGISNSAGIDVGIDDMDVDGSVSVSGNYAGNIGNAAIGVLDVAEAKGIELTIEGDSDTDFTVRRDVKVDDNTTVNVGSVALGVLSFSQSAGIDVLIDDMDVDGSVSVSGNDAQNIFAASAGLIAVTEAKGVEVSIEGESYRGFTVGGEVEVDGNTAMYVASVAIGGAAFSESAGVDVAIDDMNVRKDVSVSKNDAGYIGDASAGLISTAEAKGVALTIEGESDMGFTVGGNVDVDRNTAMYVASPTIGLLSFSESTGIDVGIEDMNVGKDVSVSKNDVQYIGDPSIGGIAIAEAKGIALTI